MIIHNGGGDTDLESVVLFPFDDYSVPFQHGLRLHLTGYQARVGGTRVVVPPGPPGAPDSHYVTYYGTVRRVGDELWMWYLGQGDEQKWHQRVCFARSTDGYHWEKPDLGLVSYKGAAANNLVDLAGGRHHVTACVVFHEPDEADPARRFKMAFESPDYGNRVAVAFSEDGLRWTEPDEQPVGPGFEMAGGTRWNGCYYITGQGGTHFGPVRQLATLASYDFQTWTQSSCLGLRRGGIPPRAMTYGVHAGEQVHLGAGLWNRGNVIIGFYGQWHGHRTNDRRLTAMDIGLVVSVDALHYKEPIPDFRIVSAAEDGWDPIPADIDLKYPALIQGQGLENVGDETLFWYAPWPEHRSDGVRLATWGRDRLGSFRAQQGVRDAHVISAPIDLGGRGARIYANVDGICEHAELAMEVLDEQFRPLPGYSAAECIGPKESGFHQPVSWQGRETLEASGGRVRIRANLQGLRPEDVRLYAVYAEEA